MARQARPRNVSAAQARSSLAKVEEYLAAAENEPETAHRVELEDYILRFLAFAPEHANLADEISREAATRAGEVGSGRVGRTRMLSVEERALLAARALIRHRYTSYDDDLFDASMEDPWDEAFGYRGIKAEAQSAVDEFLDRHRATPRVYSSG